jgi:hypothetical protein
VKPDDVMPRFEGLIARDILVGRFLAVGADVGLRELDQLVSRFEFNRERFPAALTPERPGTPKRHGGYIHPPHYITSGGKRRELA